MIGNTIWLRVCAQVGLMGALIGFNVHCMPLGYAACERKGESRVAEGPCDRGITTLLHEKDGVDARDAQGRTALHQAASGDTIECVRWLLDHGADVNALDDNRRTPLHRAGARGAGDIVALLVARGADIGVRDNERKTVFDVMDELVRLLWEGGDVLVFPFFDALRHIKPDAVQDVYVSGVSALHKAVLYYSLDDVKRLLSKGADVDRHTDLGISLLPLHMVTSAGLKDRVELFLANGADPNARSYDERTALHYAAAKGHASIASALLARGANVNARDGWGRTPLCKLADGKLRWAQQVAYDKYEIGPLGEFPRTAEILIKAGADVNAKTPNGSTALHLAAYRCRYFDIIELLVAHGADRNARDNSGETPCDFAQRRFSTLPSSHTYPWILTEEALVRMQEERRIAEKITEYLCKTGGG